jgi:hypothetical protein
MEADPDIVGWSWKIGFLSALGLLRFFTKREINKVDEGFRDMKTRVANAEEKNHANELNLSNFKTHVSETYAKEATMQQSLARIHDRMDEGFTELREDIKNLIGKVK